MVITNSILDIIKSYHIKTMILFGSRARGDSREDSDYDNFIVNNSMSIDKEFELEGIFEDEFNNTVDLIRFNKDMDKVLLKNILNDGIVLYNEDDEYEKIYNYIDNFFIENHDFIKLREGII